MDLEQNVRGGIAPRFLDDMGQTMTGLRTLATYDRDGAHVLAAHDAEVFNRYPAGVGAGGVVARA